MNRTVAFFFLEAFTLAGGNCQSESDPSPALLLAILMRSSGQNSDLLTPQYHNEGSSSSFGITLDSFLAEVRNVPLQNPLSSAYTIPSEGTFAANKGAEYHHAVDLHPDGFATNVNIYAAHDGTITRCQTQGLPGGTVYRHFITISQDIQDSGATTIGKLVTIYGHLALDLDTGMPASGSTVSRGQLISQHLYSGTVGGPHLHFEIRYYRPTDSVVNGCTLNGTSTGIPEYYQSFASGSFTTRSAGPWSLGFWDPSAGYGYGYPANRSLNL
ncbi:MAG: M23 family metallopeptidase [Spirochaetales bacterium]|nr:M23 family metallopeptidase [Leptospiraceae bacterium]MCP5482016.1 M23 family metallopeptidase [Spirochaetales bacterium]MCP5486497.1 M23 family metallopeptidase [Spirochaetales bacterium]